MEKQRNDVTAMADLLDWFVKDFTVAQEFDALHEWAEAPFTCPVCEWPDLEDDPRDSTFEICPQCGCEFGYDDAHPTEPVESRWAALREEWIAGGRKFWSVNC